MFLLVFVHSVTHAQNYVSLRSDPVCILFVFVHFLEFGTLCDAPLLNIDYTITIQNAIDTYDVNSGFTQLSADDRPIWVIYIIATCIQLIVMVFALLVMKWLRENEKGNLLHHTVKILFASIVGLFVGFLCYTIHLSVFGVDGIGVVGLVYVAHICFALSTTMMLLDVVVIAKGWTIVRRKISAGGRMKIAAFLTMFFILYIACIFWAELNQVCSLAFGAPASGPTLTVCCMLTGSQRVHDHI